MTPGPTSSVPHRARRSALACTPPKLRRLGDERAARRGRPARAASVPRSKLRTEPTPGQRTSATSARAREERGQRPRGRLLALEPDAERRQRAVREPRLERPGDRARSASARPAARPPAPGRRPRRSPRSRSLWPGQVLRRRWPRRRRRRRPAPRAPQRRGQRRVRGDLGARVVRGRRPGRARSSTASPGFDGVSTHTTRAPGSAARKAASSLVTSRTSTPRAARCRVATSRTPG